MRDLAALNLVRQLRENLERLDCRVCNCELGPHLEVERNDEDGEFVRFSDVENFLSR